ncbi:O-methyltransferase [Atopobacter phocae]|uniref:O-methyltransferase n=1 Tax=Atopobacter phocae TaxID=136492 RepID=UPI0004BBAF3C|nr:O-methyltransferase [Atopobacter phocae]
MKLNEMMDRPVVMEKIVHFLRDNLPSLSDRLTQLEHSANERRVPIIPRETAAYLDQLLTIKQPQKILEVGTAIGYSASLMAQYAPVWTIERNPVMWDEAEKTFETNQTTYPIHLLKGDAMDWLNKEELKEFGPFDVIFLDSAKAKYIEFLPLALNLLAVNGVILIDDVFQGGTIFDPIETIPRRVRNIHRKLNRLFQDVLNHPDLKVSVLPLGDGLMVITKKI